MIYAPNDFYQTTLSGAIDDTQTSFDVASAVPPDMPCVVRIDNELLLVTGAATNTWTVVRGYESTTASAHASGETATVVLTAAVMDSLRGNNKMIVGPYGSVPAAGQEGRIYLTTDSVYMMRDNGTSWDHYGPVFPCKRIDISQWTAQVAPDDSVTRNGVFSMYTSNKYIVYSKPLDFSYPYTVTMGMSFYSHHTSSGLFGFVLRNVTTGAGEAIYVFNGNRNVFNAAMPSVYPTTTFGGAISNRAIGENNTIKYLRMTVTRPAAFFILSLETSPDNIHYNLQYERTATYNADISEVCILANVGTPGGWFHIYHWEETQLS